MAEYKQSFKRPFTDGRKFLVGCILYMIPIVNVITSFFALGYVLRCARRAMVNDYRLPEWDDWGEMFVKGILATVISIIYMLPALVLGYLFGGKELLISMATMDFTSGFNAQLIIPLVFMLLASYIIPYAILSFVDVGRFESAFKILKIAEKAFTLRYFAPWLAAFVYGSILFSVAYILNFYLSSTIVLPFIISAVAMFINGVTSMSILGGAYKELERIYFKM